MLKNYLISAWRNLRKNRLPATINILGLAVGLAACLVILLLVRYEFSYDRHHPDAERIFRVTTEMDFGSLGWIKSGGVYAPLPAVLRGEFTGLSQVTALQIITNAKVATPEGLELGEQQDVAIVDSSYFQIFPRAWLAGSPISLAGPYRVVLSDRRARTYFGNRDPVGETLVYFDSIPFTVVGVVADEERQTDLAFAEYLSYETLHTNKVLGQRYSPDDWNSVKDRSVAFVKLEKHTAPQAVESQFAALTDKYIKTDGRDTDHRFNLQLLQEMHFDADVTLPRQRTAHKPTLYGLLAIALFLILVAAINFINLETARAGLRASEVGVRKVLGSRRSQLVQQFMGETMLITALAGVLSLALAQLALDYFSDALPPGLSLERMLVGGDAWLLLAIVLVVSLLAGLYPAFVLSGYSPTAALKSQTFVRRGTSRQAYLRRSLIVFQFAISQAFILITLIIGSQISYVLHKDMGFRTEAIVHFQTPLTWEDTTNRRYVLANELRNLSGVEHLSMSTSLPATGGHSSSGVRLYPDTTDNSRLQMYHKMVDTAFLATYDLSLIAGRNLLPSDTLKEVILNETAIRQLGFTHPAEALGQQIDKGSGQLYPIVGVVADFHDGPLHEAIHPLMLGAAQNQLNVFNVRLSVPRQGPVDLSSALQSLERTFRQFYPELPFTYHFYDDTIADFYQTEQRTAKIINAAMLMAVLISCLGLFGLVSFTTHQRTKEIGIRKVLGASVRSLLVMFSQEFVWLVLAAFVVATPVAWYFTRDWLADFAYRVAVGPGVFALTVLTALIIALLTVGVQAWRAATANPVDSLRSE